MMALMIGPDDRRYQVFVSSTFDDLQEERQHVLQAILEMKAFPTGMELFPSANDEQWAFIEREIESSDYYIVITAGKYGSLAEDGRSFTEKEYDHAIGSKKYVMSFLRRDLSRLEGRRLEQEQSRREKLEAFHEKVKRSKLVKFYESAAELKSLVMQALMHAFQFQPQEGWVRAKNARRLEDLEDVTRLQRQVMELQEENVKLRADPTAPFAQGDDPAEWTLHLTALTPPKASPEDPPAPPEEPPASTFGFRTTWNELLAAIFSAADPQVSEMTARARVGKLISSQITSRFPDVHRWVALQRKAAAGIVNEDMTELMISIRRQFLGLELIDVGQVQTTPFGHRIWWELKQKGRLQLLAVSGLRRSQAQPASSTP